MHQPALRTDIAIGVDGCPGGWVAAIWRPVERRLSIEVVDRLSLLIDAYPDVAIGVDIPVGLATTEPRACDVAARKLLGPGRASSVFPAPCRGILRLNAGYGDTSARSKVLTLRGIIRQTYHIIPKIAEADDAITPELQQRVFEVHPEVSFHALAGGRPMRHAKKRMAGFHERRDLLQNTLPRGCIPESRSEARALANASRELGRGAGADDVLDAIVAAWSALRFARCTSERIPEQPERDERGIDMAITF